MQTHWETGGASTIRHRDDDEHFGGGKYIMIDIEDAGTSIWSVMLNQPVDFVVGHTYKISILMDSDEKKLVGVEMGSGYTSETHYQKTFYIEGMTEYKDEFTVSIEEKTRLHYFWIGAGQSKHPLYIKYASLIDTSVPDSVICNPFSSVTLDNQTTKSVENHELLQAYPNPFNPATTIAYTLQKPGHVKLTVYDVLGKKAAVLVKDYQLPISGFLFRTF